MIRLNPKANWREFTPPRNPVPNSAWFVWGAVRACVSLDDGLWHLSVSCEYRYPTWDEIYTAWYDLVPGAETVTGAILMPPKAEYVNVHPNCFHIHQLRDTEIIR